MKLFKTYIAAIGMFGLMALASCADFGKTDPPAGNQKIASLETLASYDFEYDEETTPLAEFEYVTDDAEVVYDDSLASNVLHLNGGYIKMTNPFLDASLQSGAAISFWLKSDSTEIYSALVAIGGDDVQDSEATKFFFTENSWLCYNNPDILESLCLDVNNPDDITTGAYEADGSWHFIALQLLTDGYVLYVDGDKKAENTITDATETDFEYQDLLDFIVDQPYLYIGVGSDEVLTEAYFDDFIFYKDEMSSSEYDPNVSSSSSSSFSYIEYVEDSFLTTVGETDCSSSFWTAFSDYFRIPSGASLHLEFTNYTSGDANWDNYLVVITTDDERDGGDYSEYLVLRADAYGWGNSYVGDNLITSGFDWDTFISDINGAAVEVDVVHNGSTATVYTTATSTGGTVMTQEIEIAINEDEVIRCFLTCELAYLSMKQSSCYVNVPIELETTTVGETDCSSSFWTAFSDYFEVPTGSVLNLEFTNYTSGDANWDNYLVVVTTNDERDGGDYSEYLVLRADAYGWGNSYVGDNLETSGFDWDTFLTEINGANVQVEVVNNGSTADVTSVATGSGGTVMTEYIPISITEGTINVFLTCELSYLNMISSGCTLSVSFE